MNKAKLDTKVKRIQERYRFVVKKPRVPVPHVVHAAGAPASAVSAKVVQASPRFVEAAGKEVRREQE